MVSTRRQLWGAHVAFFLSGVAGLGYEIVWTRMFAVGLGHELWSMHAVLAALFAGFALGAWGLDRVISRSIRPGAWYAGLELFIAAWAVVLQWLIPWGAECVMVWSGPAVSQLQRVIIAFGVPAAVLLPATVAMGATLPAMERLCSRMQQDSRVVGGLYALNTLGAVVGTLLSTFVILPALGYSNTLSILAGVNLVCAVWILAGPARAETRRPEIESGVSLSGTGRLAVTLLATGVLGIGYQVLGVRVMTQVLESTVFTFAAVLAIYLLGTACGAAIYQRYMKQLGFEHGLSVLLSGLATACGIGVLTMRMARPLYRAFADNSSMAGSVLGEMMLAAAIFGPPTLLMGATFSHLAQAARRRSGGVGWALGINTAGGALAPALFGQWLLPHWGSRFALVVIPVMYVWLLPRLSVKWLAAPVVTIAVLSIARPDLVLVDTAPGDAIIAVREGAMSTAVVIERPRQERVLKVNNQFSMGGTGRGLFLERRLAHIPLLLHPAPAAALFLGMGTGITCATAADHPGVHVDGVELLPEVVELFPYFEPANAAVSDAERVHVHVADARRFIRTAAEPYDVIVADLFHPARDGAGTLYTVEHFRAVADSLSESGVFCQWLPLYQLNEDVLKTVIRSFLKVFEDGTAVLGLFNIDTPVLGLIAGTSSMRYGSDYYRNRVEDIQLVESLLASGIRNRYQLFGCYLASPAQLRAYAGDGPFNTDDHPLVMFTAPRATYAGAVSGAANLITLLDAFEPRARAWVVDDVAGTFNTELNNYFVARDRFLRGLTHLHRGDVPVAVTEFIASARFSDSFRTGYDQLMLMVRQRADQDPDGARAILEQLIDAVPERDEARMMLRELHSE